MRIPTPFGNTTIAEIAGAIAIVTAVGSLVSLFSNIFLFSLWKLDFSSVASASDIIIGGVAVLKSMMMFIFLVLAVLFISRYFVEIRRKFEITTLFFNILFSISFLAIVFYIGGLPFFYERIAYIPKWLIISLFVAYAGMLLFRDERPSPRAKAISQVYPILAFFLIVMLNATYVGQRGQGDLITVVPGSPCDGVDHVAWLGSASAIVTCDEPPFGGDNIYRIVERDGLVVETHRMEHVK